MSEYKEAKKRMNHLILLNRVWGNLSTSSLKPFVCKWLEAKIGTVPESGLFRISDPEANMIEAYEFTVALRDIIGHFLHETEDKNRITQLYTSKTNNNTTQHGPGFI